ncbi:phage head-tail connector protein [Streptomyces sp. NPDC026665]|uniref:head-tail connector protein n=1 Tax=Streptomyces sp. NPDC026665 TaxID=3154798 RepID=UPI0033F50644
MIDLGAVYQVAVDVADASGTPTNPADATLTIILPDGTTVGPAVPAPTTTGQLRVDYVTAQTGRHVWRLVTSGPTTAYADVFDVQPAAPDSIVSLAEARAHLNMRPDETSDDDELRGFIAAATRAVERALGRKVVRRTLVDRFDLRGPTTQVMLRNVPVQSITSVVSADGATTWNVADLQVDGETGLVTVVSGARLTGSVDITSQAGMSVIPDDYRLAGKIIIGHLWETQRGTMGVQLGDNDEAYVPGRSYAVPRRALELLDAALPGVA